MQLRFGLPATSTLVGGVGALLSVDFSPGDGDPQFSDNMALIFV
ncbi:hypothetical protein [Phormidesmis priestleyi]